MAGRFLSRFSRSFEYLPLVVTLISALFLAFLWGAAAVKWKIFPHSLIAKAEAGFDALSKLEDDSLPHHTIRSEIEADGVDPVTSYGPAPEDTLVLMTGGFDYRRDLCPDFGCIAMVMERDGTVLHTWEYDPAKLFTADMLKGHAGERGPDKTYVQGVDLAPNGDLVVTFQGTNMFPYQVGVARFGWDGTLKWVKADMSHHWPTVTSNGEILTPIAHIERNGEKVAGTRQNLNCKSGAVYQEGVQMLDPDGTEHARYWMDNSLRKSDKQGLAFAVRDDCDPYHVNGVDEVNAAMAARVPEVSVGDLIVSLRSSSSLVVVDKEEGTVKDVMLGPMVAQHSPRVLPDGDIILFDNMGGSDTRKGTRILVLDPATQAARRVFPVDMDGPGGDLDSLEEGSVRPSPDGHYALIAETLNGRIIEADLRTGKAVWIYTSISDIAPALKDRGQKPDGPVYALMQTQGADYITREDYRRFSGE
ncbi:MAG: hypothetical protein KDA73_05340 [Rhodobacteraceae bacterium]|nr:hypothetical protein [Paracoccaceae bacterium]